MVVIGGLCVLHLQFKIKKKDFVIKKVFSTKTGFFSSICQSIKREH